MLRRLAIGTALLALGCNLALVRLERSHEHDEVIARVSERSWPPRRAGARAFASALVATGDPEHARDVLLGDYRRGGQVASLVQLADLERSLGRDGVAAVHYVRVDAIDHDILVGRRDVCALLRTRAASWVALSQGEAALDDLDVAARLCGGDDASLRTRATAQAAAMLRERPRVPVCTGDCSAPTPAAILDAALVDARRQGPEALRMLALGERLTLTPEDIVPLLLADARGEAGRALVDDDELRGWLGDAEPESFVGAVRSLSVPEGSYVRLRLERVWGRSPDGGAASPSQRAIWLDRASVIEGAQRWRLLAYAGDLTAAEHDIVARWRPRSKVTPADASAVEVLPEVAQHWALRLPVTASNYRDLLILGRLRDAANDRDLGLELRREVVRSAVAAGLEGANEALREEVRAALGWGRPWLALALADAGPSADLEPWRRAAATGILLSDVMCQGPCDEDAADLQAIGRVLGEPWVEAQRASLRELALGHEQPRAPAGACPDLEEVLAPGARSPVARALARARDRDDVGLGRVLITAIESDPSLACGARHIVPLLVAREAGVSAKRLSDFLTHGTPTTVGPAMIVHAALATIGGQARRAEHLGIAAAAAGQPRQVWRSIARVARRVGARDLEVYALRELLLQTPAFADESVRRELVGWSIVDGARAWGPRDTPAGREAVEYIVAEHLERLHPAQRWAEREALLTVVERHGIDDDVRAVLERAVLRNHATAPVAVEVDWRPRAMAEAVRARRLADAPPSMRVFADVGRMAPGRVALAETARDWGLRRRLAIGLATTGTASERARGVASLLSMATPPARAELERLLLARPAAMDTAPEAVVDEDEVLLHLIFGLPTDDALWLAGAPQ